MARRYRKSRGIAAAFLLSAFRFSLLL